MRPTGRRPAVVLALSAVLVPATALLPSAAQAQAPTAQGWWTSLPAPPDVGADDLLLQGGDPARALPDTGELDRSPSPTALAALRFVVPPDATVGALVLPVAAGARVADVRVYPAASPWSPAQGGGMADAPALDPTRYAAGALDPTGTALVFADAGRLVPEDGRLSLVLVPGPLDRVVVHRPGPLALAVVRAGPSGAPSPVPVAVAGSPGVGPGVVVAAPPFTPVAPPAPAEALPAAPVVVPPAAPAPVAAAAPSGPRRLVADDRRTRVVLAVEALLLLATFGLLGQGPLAALARTTGVPVVTRTARGVGRFAREREGPPPRL